MKKTPKDSEVIMHELVLPNDTNMLNNLMGGRLLHWMDIASGIVAQRHAGAVAVTASVDNVSFAHPIGLGQVVSIKARITRSFNSSMEVFTEVTAEDNLKGTKISSNSAYYTFVAVDEQTNKITVPELVPETEEEKQYFKAALRRRELRLVLAGKMNPREATELKSIFSDKAS
ncbi:MAG: acyl-CoA thioesterase [Reichenbachiella sp.]